MKKRFSFDRLMRDWIVPLAILAAVIWLLIWMAAPAEEVAVEPPEDTEPAVIVQMVG